MKEFICRIYRRSFLFWLMMVCCYPLGAEPGLRLNMGFYYPAINDTADRTDIEVTLTFWTQEITEETDISESNARLYDTIDSMRDAFEGGEIDMIIAPPLAIARYFKREELADGFVGVREGGENNSLLLLANKASVKSLTNLRGKRLIMPENDELAEVFLDTLMLKTYRQGYKKVFSVIQPKRKINRIVLDLFFNKADAAMVYAGAFEVMAELNPQIKTRLKVLASYPVRAKNFSYFNRNYPLRELLTKKAMSYGEFPRAKQLLAVYKTPELDYCRVDDLRMFDLLYQEYTQLKQDLMK
ncbi:MAG: PhnD/SsuA/transferrin family substrate-binding protein [Gammaproteobacteria bacterium]